MTRSPLYSAIFGFCCLAFCAAGCSGSRQTLESDARGSLALRSAIDSYGAVTNPEVTAYLLYLGERLVSGLNAAGKNCPNCDLTLLNTREPLAYSPGPGHIVLSRGMFVRLQSEAELAFVVAHEMAHQVLAHHAELAAMRNGGAEPKLTDPERAALEEEADAFAVGLLAVSGYDPRAASTALLNAYGRPAAAGQLRGYSEIEKRQRLVEAEIEKAKWRPPGTVTRREFEKIRRMLAAQ